jgi:hypothetical protein
MLSRSLGKRVEAYVDDVVIKTENSENFIEDLQLVFNSLRRYRWKLNPEKRVFGVPAEKLLGFIVSHRGIEANPKKSRPSWEWKRRDHRRKCKGLLDAWQPWAGSYQARRKRLTVLQIAQEGGQV